MGAPTKTILSLSVGNKDQMSPWVPPARLDPEIYRYWIDENPKKILGGQLRLVSNHNPPHFDDDVNLASHRIVTNVLSSPHADDLIIFGFPHKYRGFKIIVKNETGYLLMAHELHPSGPFRADDGRMLTEDHPHFHQLDYDHRNKDDGLPGTKRIAPPVLHPGINPAELLGFFKIHYSFDDGSSESIEMPQIKQVQTGLGDIP